MNLSCLECVNEDAAMSSSPPPATNPRADSPDDEDLYDGMPIPFHHNPTLNDIHQGPIEASLSSQSFLEMVCYFFDDFFARVSGKRKQDETTPMPCSVSLFDIQTGISPLPSPGPPARIPQSKIAVTEDLWNAPTLDNKAKKLKSSVSIADSLVKKTKDPPSPPQAKVAGENRSSHFVSTIASGESVSPSMTASTPPPEENLATDDVDDMHLSSIMVTPTTLEHEMRDNVPGAVDTTPDSQEWYYPRPKPIDWDGIDEGMDSLFLLPLAQTVPDGITKAAAQDNLKPRGTLMNLKDRFSSSKTNPIIISKRDVTDQDVLCGRDSRGSKHPGNVFYRGVVGKNRHIYQAYAKRQKKTDLSTVIIEDVINGRFLTKPHKNSKHYKVLTWDESRKKVSQSLRENRRRKK